MLTILLIILLILLGGGAGYYGHHHYSKSGLSVVLGVVLFVLLALWLIGGLGDSSR
jgi:hypothetical protein